MKPISLDVSYCLGLWDTYPLAECENLQRFPTLSIAHRGEAAPVRSPIESSATQFRPAYLIEVVNTSSMAPTRQPGRTACWLRESTQKGCTTPPNEATPA